MIAHQFKGGIGTASRLVGSGHTLGVLVQANYGGRSRFAVAGAPVGKEIPDLMPNWSVLTRGSIIVVVATDAPLLPQQLQRLAERVPLAIGRLGGLGGNGSGDIFIAFSTGNPGAWSARPTAKIEVLPNADMGMLFEATVEATEEAILNAMVAAETMTGRDGLTAHALPHDRLQDALKKYNRWVDPGSLPRSADVSSEALEPLAGTYRGDGTLDEISLHVDDATLYIDLERASRRVVLLTDGRFLILGTSGLELQKLPEESGEPTRLRLVRNGEVVAQFERVGE
jgi:hypothetical protein